MDEEIKEILESVIAFLDEIGKLKPTASMYDQACQLLDYKSAITNTLYTKEEIEEAIEAHTY